jgi:hypothetical protein
LCKHKVLSTLNEFIYYNEEEEEEPIVINIVCL